MLTRKLKDFEYAGFVDQDVSHEVKNHLQQAFNTPNGYAMVVASCDKGGQTGQELAATAVERIKYYLENEVPDDAMHAVHNALLYANGYIYEQRRKESEGDLLPVSCLCVLVNNQKVFYSWAGQVCMYLFNGKKLIPLAISNTGNNQAEAGQAAPESGAGDFLGVQKMIAPGLCNSALKPVNHDMVLLGTQAVCQYLREKAARKVMQDSMPVQAKVMRLGSIMRDCGNKAPVAVQLLSFYNIGNKERHYSPIAAAVPAASAASPRIPKVLKSNGNLNWIKIAGIAAGFLLVAYMIYDLFLFEPQPPAQIITVDPIRESVPDTLMIEEEPAIPPLPQDESYTVREGDTWGRIYQRYQVCSWFIRNHPPNRNYFTQSNDLVSGMNLRIPVKYSADPSFNPEFYQEFTTDNVGTRCENAGEEFIQEFEQSIAR